MTLSGVGRDLVFVGSDFLRPRMVVEQEKLRKAFPGMSIYATGDQVTSVQGWLMTTGGASYHVRVEVPATYPETIPRIFLTGLIREGYSKHRYTDGNICIMRSSQWSSAYSLAYVVVRAAKWAEKYEIWRKTGRWPGREQEH